VTSGKVATTIGYERRNNPALRLDNRDAFIRFMTSDQAVRPANMANIVAINQGRAPLTMEAPTAPALEAVKVAGLVQAGHLVLDTRSSAAFGAAHVPGALHVHLSSPEFEQRVGWVAPPGARFVLVLEDAGTLAPALAALAFVGLDAHVAGHLRDGMAGWQRAGYPTAAVPQMSVQDVHARLVRGELSVLDVRERAEWIRGHIEGARHSSYRQLTARLPELRLAPDAPLAVICHGGARSSTAASLLARQGFRALVNVTGGMVAWEEAGLPVETGLGRLDRP
jgi:rhodanese-related sulfurtransferase